MEIQGGETGMPEKDEYGRMQELEEAIQAKMEKTVCILTTTRTGNGLREWDYYTKSQEDFAAALKQTLSGKPQYPIAIRYYEEPNWESFRALLAAVKK
jgi:Family of unknown function (DUF695)